MGVQICEALLSSPVFSVHQLSPLILPYLYQSTILRDESYRESRSDKSYYYEDLETLKRGLVELNKRWLLAGKLVTIQYCYVSDTHRCIYRDIRGQKICKFFGRA